MRVDRWRWSTTASTATPIALPSRITTLSCGVASESWSGRITENAAVIAGMKEKPIERPRTTSTSEISSTEVCAPTKASGRVLSESTSTPRIAMRPPPKRSVIFPAIGIATSAPMPCGPVEQAGVDHVVAADLLVVERHEDHRAEERGTESEGGQRGSREDAVFVKPHVEQGALDAQRVQREEDRHRHPDRDRDEHPRGADRRAGSRPC